MRSRGFLLAAAIYALAAANLVALWVARGPYVTGWDLSGATFGVLALSEGSLADGVRTILAATLHQRRPVFTGGESLVHGLIPGLLTLAVPSLFWGHVLNLALFGAISAALVRWLGCRSHVYCACILASPALVSYAIVAYPYVPSTTIPFGLAIGWVLAGKQKRRTPWWGLLLDVPVFAGIAAYAFNGYEAGKTFFVVPAVAALTVTGLPLLRRLGWMAVAAAIAWLVFDQRPGTTAVVLASVPHDPVLLARGALRTVQWYLDGWSIDYPGLPLAALLALPTVPTERRFWTGLLAAAIALVSLNVFNSDGAFLTPHRFLLLGFVAALVVSVALSRATRWTSALVGAALLVAGGIASTSWHTVRFVLHDRPADALADTSGRRVYPLPFHRARLDQHVHPRRIHDATRLVEVIRRGSEPHLFFYGFSVLGEDSVNPQLLFSRLILSLGYPTFRERIRFVDHFTHMLFQFPISPVADVPQIAQTLATPFFVHVRAPEYSPVAVLLTYFNRARATPVDLGLHDFVSFRIESFAPPGPIPVLPLRPTVGPPAPTAEGYCRTTLHPVEVMLGTLHHHGSELGDRLDFVLQLNDGLIARDFIRDVDLALERSTFTQLVGRFDNPGREVLPVRLSATAGDELAILLNGQLVAETLSTHAPTLHAVDVLLPPGPTELRVAHHQLFQPGPLRLTSTDAEGRSIPWRCDAPEP